MQFFNEAQLTPLEVYAGDSVEFVIRLTAGRDFTASGLRIVLDLPGELGYSRPTRGNPEDPGYIDMRCSNPSLRWQIGCCQVGSVKFERLETLYENKHAQRLCVIDFLEGTINTGDTVTIIWGSLRNGFGQGTKVGTIVPFPNFSDKIDIRIFQNGRCALPDYGHFYDGYERPSPDQEFSLSFRLLPREVSTLRLLSKQKENRLLILDRFSNLCQVEQLDGLVVSSLPAKSYLPGAFCFNKRAKISSTGRYPIVSSPEASQVYDGYSILFGDLHTHSAYSYDCIEREKMHLTPADSYRYGRDVACLDFMAITDHHVPWGESRRKISRENWEQTLEAVRDYNTPGDFLAFAGIEVKDARGDTALVFGEPFTYEEITHPSLKDLSDFWARYQGRNYLGIPHFHNPGSLLKETWRACPDNRIEPVVEISSCHGTYEAFDTGEPPQPLMEHERPDRCGRFLLSAGYQYGFVCNSDGHKGNPGQNGLTAVFVREDTQEAVLQAIRQRHTYGTTNARIRLLFLVDRQLMGAVLPAHTPKQVELSITGESDLLWVEAIANGKIVRRFFPEGKQLCTHFQLSEIEKGYCYIRVTQKDGHRAYSSAVWFI